MKKGYSFSILIILLLGLSVNLFAEKFSERKIMVRFKSDIRENPAKIINYENRLSAKIEPILSSNYSTKYNPKKFFEIQSQKLNYSEIQKAEEPLLRTYIIEFKNDINPKYLCKKLKESYTEIEIAEPCHIYEIQAFTPNDTKFSSQTSLNNIKPKEAWEVWKGNSSVIIGISDNGVNQDHEDLEPNIAVNTGEIPDNMKDDDGNGYIDDYNGFNFGGAAEGDWGNTFNSSIDHGSLVAGIAAAKFNNSKGIAGIAGECRFFPIKVGGNSSSIIYGYESMIYAASKHFSVLNLSWGGPQSYSELEQSIINYAIANGVAIVASGGNIGTNGGTRYDTYYPAGYSGVLGVGEVDSYDQITVNGSCMGVAVDILAPGKGDYSTNNYGNYEAVGMGTSFASPVVAGAVALVRSKYPNLTPLQALEFVRLSVDDILSENPTYSDKILVPGRVNLYKAVTVDPYSIPSVRPVETNYLNTAGVKTNRFEVGDTVVCKIKFTNYLGKATNIKFKISVVYDPMNSVSFLQNQASLASLNTSEFAEISDFKLLIKKSNTNRIIFRLDIEADNGFKDFAKIDFIPTANFTTFETDKIAFSMSDEGNFGFVEIGGNKEGAGFTIKGTGNQLFGESGILISENNSKLVSYLFANLGTVKKFTKPNQNINILNDNYTGTSDQIGLEIKQEVSFPDPNVAQLDLTAKNISTNTLKDLSLGYFYDWDIEEDADSNVAVLFDEINSSEYKDAFPALGAELVYKPNVNIFVGCVAFSKESGSQPQIAGLDYDYTNDFDKSRQLNILNSGMSLQNNKIYDRSVFTGIKLFGNIKPQEERKISLLIAGNTTKDALKNNIIKSLSMNSIIEKSLEPTVLIIPEPSLNQLKIVTKEQLLNDSEIEVFDFSGNKIMSNIIGNYINQENILLIQIPNLSTQVLFVRINSGLHNIAQKVLWVK